MANVLATIATTHRNLSNIDREAVSCIDECYLQIIIRNVGRRTSNVPKLNPEKLASYMVVKGVIDGIKLDSEKQ